MNLYAYAGNNPVAFADPFGLCKEKDEFCRRIREFFATRGGPEAAPIVEALDSDAWTLRVVPKITGGDSPDANAFTFLDGSQVIEINEGRSFKQQVATTNHEFWQHALSGRGDHGDQYAPRTQVEARVLHHLDLGRGIHYSTEVAEALRLQGLKLPQPWCSSCTPQNK